MHKFQDKKLLGEKQDFEIVEKVNKNDEGKNEECILEMDDVTCTWDLDDNKVRIYIILSFLTAKILFNFFILGILTMLRCNPECLLFCQTWSDHHHCRPCWCWKGKNWRSLFRILEKFKSKIGV